MKYFRADSHDEAKDLAYISAHFVSLLCFNFTYDAFLHHRFLATSQQYEYCDK